MIYTEVINISNIPGLDIDYRHNDNLSTENFDKRSELNKKTIEFDMEIFGETVLFRINVVPRMIKLSEIVPLAYEIASIISNIILKRSTKEGLVIPCQKGCAACCNYLVPLSIPEAFHLRRIVLGLSEHRRNTIFNSFLVSAKCILNNQTQYVQSMGMDELSMWYTQLNLRCPFLSDNICSIYDKRPIACREHLVTDSNYFCNPNQEIDFNKIVLPVGILECLGVLNAELKNTDIEAIMMPLALLWAQDNPGGDNETWPSVEIVRRFTEIIKKSSEISNPLALC